MVGRCLGLVVTFSVLMVIFLGEAIPSDEATYQTEEIFVFGQKEVLPAKEATEAVYTGYELTERAFRLVGEGASSNVWAQLGLLPGVVFMSPDPANAASTQVQVMVRGISGSLGTMTVGGIPIYGGNPIGPRPYIVDVENFQSMAVYKGAIPTELGTGVGTRGGLIELRPKWAEEKTALLFKQSIGSYAHSRTFMRLDSGCLGPWNTRFSLSFSYTEGDKWKGEGEIGPRRNLNFTLVQPLSERFTFKLWGNYNYITHHAYRSLSYEQAMDPERFYRWDWSGDLTGDPNTDWQYYKFNKLSWTNHDLYGFFEAKLLKHLKLELKPYLREEEKEEWTGSQKVSGPRGQSKPGVQVSSWTARRWGVISQAVWEYRTLKAVLGYHYEESEFLKSQSKNFWLNQEGSLSFVGWGRFTESTGPTVTQSPYIGLSGIVGKFRWQLGIKYFEMYEPKSEGYVTKYKQDGTPYLEREPKMDYGERTYTNWVPSFGLSYTFGPNFEPYLSFGRTFQRPYAYMPIINLYYRLYPKFTKLGIGLSDLFEGYRCEETDNLDLGLRLRGKGFEFNPVLFLQRHKNLRTPVTPGWPDPDDPTKPLLDPNTGKPVSFETFVGKARGYGFELASSLEPIKGVRLFFNPAYTDLKYKGDIVNQGVLYSVDGKQVINVPKWTFTSGLQVEYKGFRFAPVFRYIGESYGDLAYKERIPGYTVLDLRIAFVKEHLGKLKDVKVSLDLYNLLDKKYVIPRYYYGPPFAVYGSLSFKF